MKNVIKTVGNVLIGISKFAASNMLKGIGATIAATAALGVFGLGYDLGTKSSTKATGETTDK